MLGLPSMAADFDLLKEEILWKGEVGGERKATKGHGPLGHNNAPTTPPLPLPQATPGRHNSGPCSGQAQPGRWLAWTGNKVRWLQGQPHGQLRVARKPQQEFGQGVAGMPQECPGRARRLQERPQVRQEWAPVAVEPQEMWAVAQPLEMKVSGGLSHHYRQLNRHSCGQAARPSHLRKRLSSMCPQSFQLATHQWVSNLHYHLQDGCISSLAGLLHCLFFHLEPASQLFVYFSRGQLLYLYGRCLTPRPQAGGRPSPGHLVTWTTRPNSSHHQLSLWWCWCLFRHRFFSGGRLPYVCIFTHIFFLHWLLHGHPLLLHLHHILAWS